MSFDKHVSGLCTKASQKLHALLRVSPYVDIIKCRTIMNSLSILSLVIVPLVWMFHNRMLNNRINKIHERVSRMNCSKITLSGYMQGISRLEQLNYTKTFLFTALDFLSRREMLKLHHMAQKHGDRKYVPLFRMSSKR